MRRSLRSAISKRSSPGGSDASTGAAAALKGAVCGLDHVVIGLNERAAARLRCERRVEIVPGATHLFEESGKLEAVARIARDWFERHLCGTAAPVTEAPGAPASD